MTISWLGGRRGGRPVGARFVLEVKFGDGGASVAAGAPGEELQRSAEGGGALAGKVNVKSIKLILTNRLRDAQLLLVRPFHLLVEVLRVGGPLTVVVGVAVALGGGG